jgi:hypothetical protein
MDGRKENMKRERKEERRASTMKRGRTQSINKGR